MWYDFDQLKKAIKISFVCSPLYIYLIARKIYYFNYLAGLPVDNSIRFDRLCKISGNMNHIFMWGHLILGSSLDI